MVWQKYRLRTTGTDSLIRRVTLFSMPIPGQGFVMAVRCSRPIVIYQVRKSDISTSWEGSRFLQRLPMDRMFPMDWRVSRPRRAQDLLTRTARLLLTSSMMIAVVFLRDLLQLSTKDWLVL